MSLPRSDSEQLADSLERKKFAEDLVKKILVGDFLKGNEANGTMAIDGAYGTGKTTTIWFLQDKFRQEGVCTVYFDAWENENFEDPIVPLLAEIRDSFEEITEKNLWEKPLKKAIPFLPSNLCGIDIKDGVKNLVETKGQNSLTQEFKKSLGEALAKMFGQNEHVKLVIFVDELDRCKPTFAFQLLERIKHLFCIDKVLFVVGMDMRTMEGMVKKFYGSPDPSGYLLKFFDKRVFLPDPNRRAFMYSLMEKLSPKLMQTGHFANGIIDAFLVVASLFKFSLRQLMKAGQTLARLETTIAEAVSTLAKRNDIPHAGDAGEIIGITEAIRVHDQVLAADIFIRYNAQKGFIELLKLLIRQTKIIGINQVDISERYGESKSSRLHRLFIILVRTAAVGFRRIDKSFNELLGEQEELIAEVHSIFTLDRDKKSLLSLDEYINRNDYDLGPVYTFERAYKLLDEEKDLQWGDRS